VGPVCIQHGYAGSTAEIVRPSAEQAAWEIETCLALALAEDFSPKLGLLCRRARERGALPLALSQRPALALALASESGSAAVPERGDCGMGGV